MREFTPGPEMTVAASGALTDSRAVGFDGAQITTAGAAMFGIARGSFSDGEDARIVTSGAPTAESGGAFNVGDPLTTDANGRLVAASALAVEAGGTTVTSTAANGEILVGGETPEVVVAYALEAATGAGEFPRVFINR